MLETKTTTLAETIRQNLADDILRGVYPPGARLDESGLARRFKLSRTPVREALRQLSSVGLVEMRPRRGVIVSLPTDSALA
jgi:DNA-binding GntR family transcriptional regulator